MQDVRLFIGEMEVEFKTIPEILYNWTETDITNPTVIKNGYSKTITIEGTSNNNKIFGHFWNLERYQNGTSNNGVGYNPSYRVPFVLYTNGNVFEKGYVKLQNIKIADGVTTYEIGLFGGLGNFLYNLSVDWNTGEKKSLADLKYYMRPMSNEYEQADETEVDLDFVINKETVLQAWNWSNMAGWTQWRHINFIPAYNGLSDKMSNDKVLIHFNEGTTWPNDLKNHIRNGVYDYVPPIVTSRSGGVATGTYYGFCLGELPAELNEWEVKDLRSWAQRPCIKVETILDAIRRKVNNRGKYDSGYEVILDYAGDDRIGFFSDDNPYIEDAWMTLPLITDLEFETTSAHSETYTANWASCNKSGNSYTYVFNLSEPVTDFGRTVDLKFDLYINVPGATAAALYPSYWINAPYKTFFVRNAVGVQAYASNVTGSNGDPLPGASEVAWLCYEYAKGYDNVPYKSYPATYDECVKNKTYKPILDTGDVKSIDGHFVRVSNGLYRWNSQLSLKCSLPVGATCFKINVQMSGLVNANDSSGYYTTLLANDHRIFQSGSSPIPQGAYVYSFNTSTSDKNTFQDRTFVENYAEQTNYYSNKMITKKMLLSTDYTPADWLLAYCKMFGLYLYKDPTEDKIYITSRTHFYRRNNVKDISKYIDYSKELTITPVYVDSNYYSMKNDFEESGTFKNYLDKYGKTYGMKIINTGFEFNADTKELLDIPFKGAVQNRGNSQYYFKPDSNGFHPYVYNGVRYTLYCDDNASQGSIDWNVPLKQISTAMTPYDTSYPYFDLFDKPEFCGGDGSPVDGANVLVFFRTMYGTTSMPSQVSPLLQYNFIISDDCDAMARLNNGPCYLMEWDAPTAQTAGALAYKVTQMPYFSRYFSPWRGLENNNGRKIEFSMDWGSPRELYVPNLINSEWATLYYQFYGDYLADLYDVNTKVLSCYVKPDKVLTQDDMRNFYWFQNGIWRLNKVIDYNPNSENPVKCEFIKVQDLANMTSYTPDTLKCYGSLTLSTNSVPASGGTITATLVTSSGGGGSANGCYDPELQVTPEALGGDGTFEIVVPPNEGTEAKTYIFGVRVAEYTQLEVNIYQAAQEEFCTVSPTAITFDSTGESVSVLISGNTPWVVSGRPGWISMSRTSGSGTFYNMATASENASSNNRYGTITISPQGLDPITISVAQLAAQPAWSGEISFTFEPFQSTGQGFWDDYMIFYDFEGHPILSGQLLGYIPLGVQAYSGDWIYPDNYHYLSDDPNYVNSSAGFTSDTENDVFVPESFAGRTIYFQVEVGSQELGAKQSQVVSATIPQNGGTVYVTIPSF